MLRRGPHRASILLLAYRMENTLRPALASALAQTVPCEIIVSDDASGDRSLEIAREMTAAYAGPHKVIIRGNEQNQGLCRHIDTVSKIASGEILIFMAADDVSYPQRVARLLAAFDAHADAYAVGSAVDEIDVSGQVLRRGAWYLDSPMDQRKLLHLGKFVTLLGASMSLRRELLDDLPPLTGLVEDNMLTLRASLFGRIYCLKESLLGYRRHEGNLGRTVFVRTGPGRAARRKRYERTIRMYREIANDHERCLQALPQLPPERRQLGEQIVSMYRIEAESREAVLNLPKRQWLSPIWRGIKHPGLRRKSVERAFKLAVPRSWLLS
ncbi:glycosyltransferase [Peristeroidobacter agariperforans]|uniref:glycosyltransferase n=1 Tax=Peristeroidobacter agariperforans TaxID=268404 RepID=UPI0022B80B87|nr:glycosyltransferase [Peristeroidobacter agariperforans]